jgi:maltokinase
MTVAPWQLAERVEPALAGWLPGQRWFGGKGRGISRVELVRMVNLLDRLDDDGPLGLLAIVEVRFADGVDRADSVQLYQVPLGVRRVLPAELEPALIARLGGFFVYDAMADREITWELLRLIAKDHRIDNVHFGLEAHGGHAFAIRRGLSVRLLGVEQSNTSVVYGDRFVLKLFRRLAVGTNPDLELHRALNRANSTHIAPLLGAIETVHDATPVTLAMLHAFAADSVEGWALTTAHLRDLLRGNETSRDLGTETEALGRAVAAVHADLAGVLGTRRMSGEDVAELRGGMLSRFDATLRDVPALRPYADGVRRVFSGVGADADGVLVHRIHGDLHLGQVLRTPNRWLLIDFEGEPAAPLVERLVAQSPVRDVAGMLRSFDYAAQLELRGCRHPDPAGSRTIAERWVKRARDSFLRGYANASGTDPTAGGLLGAYELDKAVYEVRYEARNRPELVEVPLRAVRRLLHEVPLPTADFLE